MNAIDEIKEMYSLEDFNEIANHVCQSGVWIQHIYYGHTVEFYEKHEADILAYFDIHYGTEFLVDLFEKANACLDTYKNNETCAFIESIASSVVDDESLLQPA